MFNKLRDYIGGLISKIGGSPNTGKPDFVFEKPREQMSLAELIAVERPKARTIQAKAPENMSPSPQPQVLGANSDYFSQIPDIRRFDPPTGKPFELSVPTGIPQQAIEKYFSPEDVVLASLLANTEAGYDWNAISAANSDLSRDYGLFQVNSNTFNDYWGRRPGLMSSLGFEGRDVNQLLDPYLNAAFAAQIYKDQGTPAWYGAGDKGIDVYPDKFFAKRLFAEDPKQRWGFVRGMELQDILSDPRFADYLQYRQ